MERFCKIVYVLVISGMIICSGCKDKETLSGTIINGDYTCVEKMLQSGINPNQEDVYGLPLNVAIRFRAYLLIIIEFDRHRAILIPIAIKQLNGSQIWQCSASGPGRLRMNSGPRLNH